MKIYLSIKQYDDLTDEELNYLRNWWEKRKRRYLHEEPLPAGYKLPDVPVLSIGLMIDFLGEHLNSINKINSIYRVNLNDGIVSMPGQEKSENTLCDALWGACKYILQKSCKKQGC